MKKLTITGGFNSGLKAYSDKELIMFSEIEKKWFKPDIINIFYKEKTSFIYIKHKSGILKTEYQIENQNHENGNSIGLIKNGIIELLNEDKIEFKKSLTSIISNPYLKIFYKNVEIGKLNNKKIGFELNYTLFIEKKYKSLLNYILIYILTTESNKDYE